ncbi:MAG: helix-turn-helix transcriptional regulator [Lactobacillus sp.]|jgi:DNA-binding XRE family transcriptional regulator|nr:helix-turn-helix transcriptional regulator [Lactobacillus sp.]MCH4067987.1 helix-turn-helix transcriptional regulator [Lactobacillus sp.]MCI1304057.1 helix-turn-helix transcriptional regulator [Lactobacillus sp.]MCI1329917.1 helix-turn-helix transcriptional regulator [Lactobacillus sp.]MCI1399517.1 helix-turn-helix transcriptional regulator [Lactobacillus sp.]
MSDKTKISLKAARVNAGLTQQEAADRMAEYMGIKVSRQRIQGFERDPETVPPAWARGFSWIYKLPLDDLFFARRSTES